MKISEITKESGDSAVMEMLVFTSATAQENGCAPAYKLRAVLNNSGVYDGIIRCGSTGILLYNLEKIFSDKDYQKVIFSLLNYLPLVIHDSIYHEIRNYLRDLREGK